MAKVLLTFLGTGNYLECKYELNGIQSEKTQYIQGAYVDLECKNWTQNDRIVVFLTEMAKKSNWDSKDDDKAGCKRTLELRIPDTGPQVNTILIPNGKNVTEIWEIFHSIANQVDSGDEVYADITHAFRSIPLLGVIAINYSQVLKGIELKGVTYGAMEAVGSRSDLEKFPIENRVIPIFDLSPFIFLLNFSNAVNAFLSSGSAKNLCELIKKKRKNLKEKKYKDKSISSEEDQILSMFDELLEPLCSINVFTEDIMMCRGSNIRTFNYRFATWNESSFEKSNQVGLAIKPLLLRVLNQVQNFKVNRTDNLLDASEWCIRYGLIQQAYTFLREGIVSSLIDRFVGPENITQRTCRNQVNRILGSLVSQTDIESLELDSRLLQIRESLSAKIVQAIGRIKENRDCINHAGEKENPRKNEVLLEGIQKDLQEVIAFLKKI